MPAAPHVFLAGGGKAGRLFPGLAIAEHLRAALPAVELTFAGDGRARERHLVRSAGLHYTTVPAQPPPMSPLQALRFLTDNAAGYVAARWVLREQRASVVVGLGGSSCASVTRAAVARGIPVVMLEQDAIPSRTTRWLSSTSTTICAAFEQIQPHLHVPAEVSLTGNPARPEFERLYRLARQRDEGEDRAITRAARDGRPRRLVVIGGAGGARSLNEQMPTALKKLAHESANWHIVHQTGEGQLAETEARYRDAGVQALVVSYIDQVASVLFDSDLVVCRSGGTTLAELALAGVPAVLVPFSEGKDNPQLANAEVVAAAGAARVVDEESVVGALSAALTNELRTLLIDDAARRRMAQQMHTLARPRAAADIADAVLAHLGAVSRRRAA